MTLVELQAKLGEQIGLLTDKDTPLAEKKDLAIMAQTVSSLAKQMINNADVVLRTEKLVAEGKLKDSAIQQMIR
jgi:choline kinase